MKQRMLQLTVQNVPVRLSCLHHEGRRPALVCLHGFGSTKEDYVDLARHPEFRDRSLVLWDAPGFGASWIETPEALSIPFLVDTAIAACDALGVTQFHLSGHSMGGLTALMLANACPERVLSLIDIEGNVAPEDCFLSRQIVEYPAETPQDFLRDFKARVRQRPESGSALFVSALDCKVLPESVAPIFRSMVALSDTAPLMDMLARLRCPRVFIHGVENSHLSYLNDLPQIGVDVVEIAHSGHFPMYTNPPALWSAMASFLARQEARS